MCGLQAGLASLSLGRNLAGGPQGENKGTREGGIAKSPLATACFLGLRGFTEQCP